MSAAAAPRRETYQYAVVRVVPRVHRGECLNVGVVVHCPALDWIGARIELDRDRLAAVDDGADMDAITSALAAVREAVAPRGAHPDSSSRRFGWITAPRSTVVQAGPVHTGLTSDPDATLAHLFEELVA